MGHICLEVITGSDSSWDVWDDVTSLIMKESVADFIELWS